MLNKKRFFQRLFPNKNTDDFCTLNYDYLLKELFRNGGDKEFLWIEYMKDCRANIEEVLVYS